MCGIVYYKSLKGNPVNKDVLKRFNAQRNRGTSGFGFYIPEQNRLTHNTRERRIKRLLKRTPADEILFHHRFPTSTANVRNACHPFSTHDVYEHNYVLVHNGVVYNANELQADHETLDIQYVSEQPNGEFNDSEALLHDIVRTLTGEQKEMKAYGDIAFIMVESDQDNVPIKLHFGRNTNPLRMVHNQHELSLASEGKGMDIKPQTLYTYDYATMELTSKAFTIPGYTYVSTGYSHIETEAQGGTGGDTSFGDFFRNSNRDDDAYAYSRPASDGHGTLFVLDQAAQVDDYINEMKGWDLELDIMLSTVEYDMKRVLSRTQEVDDEALEASGENLQQLIDESLVLAEEHTLLEAVKERLETMAYYTWIKEANELNKQQKKENQPRLLTLGDGLTKAEA